MIYPIWNILLAVIWAAVTADISLQSLSFGYVLGFLVLWLMTPILGPTGYFKKFGMVFKLFANLGKEMVRSNLRVAYDVITPTIYMRPGVVAVPLDARTDMEIALMANMITLTPGTMSLGVSRDRKFLYVHSMFIDDPETLRREIKEGIERPLLEVMR
ncbi:MAG TPA: Na+/H+ antiporter subunit E [Planctomycetaceae bacterium]|nr:Na+/H+ antiporter subunit E [Planctomycetaceae bacterium]